jgi:hypothetical protein
VTQIKTHSMKAVRFIYMTVFFISFQK